MMIFQTRIARHNIIDVNGFGAFYDWCRQVEPILLAIIITRAAIKSRRLIRTMCRMGVTLKNKCHHLRFYSPCQRVVTERRKPPRSA
jgi:hypothetical protein